MSDRLSDERLAVLVEHARAIAAADPMPTWPEISAALAELQELRAEVPRLRRIEEEVREAKGFLVELRDTIRNGTWEETVEKLADAEKIGRR